MSVLSRAVVAIRHAIKRELIARLPIPIQEELDRRFYYRRFASGALSSEPEFQLLDDFVRAGEVTIDVGANLGGYALKMSRLVGPTGHVYCFEPVGRTFRLLQYNLQRLAPYRNHGAYRVAVGEREGTMTIRVPLEGHLPNYYVASLVGTATQPAVTETVRVVALDQVVPADGRAISLIKIDVEGAELEVLLGARRLLRQHRPAVICEVTRTPNRDGHAVFELMTELGYQAFEQRKASLQRIEGPEEMTAVNCVFATEPYLGRVFERLVVSLLDVGDSPRA